MTAAFRPFLKIIMKVFHVGEKVPYILAIALWIFLAPLNISAKLVKGADGVWRETKKSVATHHRSINTGSSKTNSAHNIKNIVTDCYSQYPEDNKKAAECVLKNSNIKIDRKVLRDCSRYYETDLKKTVSCYLDTFLDNKKDELENQRKQFRDDLLDIIEKGRRTCIQDHRYNSKLFNRCIREWNRKRREVWNDYNSDN